jgi:hypothetical protein
VCLDGYDGVIEAVGVSESERHAVAIVGGREYDPQDPDPWTGPLPSPWLLDLLDLRLDALAVTGRPGNSLQVDRDGALQRKPRQPWRRSRGLKAADPSAAGRDLRGIVVMFALKIVIVTTLGCHWTA